MKESCDDSSKNTGYFKTTRYLNTSKGKNRLPRSANNARLIPFRIEKNSFFSGMKEKRGTRNSLTIHIGITKHSDCYINTLGKCAAWNGQGFPGRTDRGKYLIHSTFAGNKSQVA